MIALVASGVNRQQGVASPFDRRATLLRVSPSTGQRAVKEDFRVNLFQSATIRDLAVSSAVEPEPGPDQGPLG